MFSTLALPGAVGGAIGVALQIYSNPVANMVLKKSLQTAKKLKDGARLSKADKKFIKEYNERLSEPEQRDRMLHGWR